MRRLARLVAVPGLAIALAAGAIVLSVVGLPDDPPPTDADLIVELPEVPYEQNGYVALVEALERGEDFSSAVRAALELPFFVRPHFEVWEDPYYFTLSWYDLRTSFERSTEAAEGVKDRVAVLQAGLEAIEVGRRVEAHVEDVYYGMALQGLGREAIRRVLPRLSLPAEHLVRAAASLTRGEGVRDRRVRFYRTAYTRAARLVEAVARGKMTVPRLGLSWRPRSIESALENVSLRFHVDGARTRPNRAKGHLVQWTRHVIAQAGLTEAERALVTGSPGPDSVFPWLASTSERTTRMFADDALDAAATAVLVALRAYQLEEDSVPDSLADLVPRYLECVPADPYDGGPLRYRPETKILHSAGDGFRDFPIEF